MTQPGEALRAYIAYWDDRLAHHPEDADVLVDAVLALAAPLLPLLIQRLRQPFHVQPSRDRVFDPPNWTDKTDVWMERAKGIAREYAASAASQPVAEEGE